MEKVILFSTGCPKCKILESKLNQKNINYDIISDVNEIKEMGFLEVPVLGVNGTFYNFSEAIKWVSSRG